MKRKKSLKSPFFSGLAEAAAVVLMMAAFIAGTYVEQGLWAMPDRVDFRQCLPWFIIFTYGVMYFNSVFDFSRRQHHIAFSIFVSIFMINVLMMALPFFAVLYYVQITTLFVIVVLECLVMTGWLLVVSRLWHRRHPPASTVILCDDPEKSSAVFSKINTHSLVYKAGDVLSYADWDENTFDPYDAVVLVKPPADVRNELALACWNKNKELLIVPDIYDLIVNNAVLMQFDDMMSYRAKMIGLTANQRIFKRFMDIVGSLLAIAILSPVMLVIALAVRRDGGPILYRQARVTRGGRVFKLIKFRTMIPDAEKHTGPTLAMKDDPRITKCGKWLRQTRLDEIPQFFNVLKGDMSIVGPRPERQHFIDLYLETLPEYQFRTNVRSGITGLAHVMGKYNTTPEERILLDLTYIQNYSPLLDLKIIIETFRVVFTKEYAEGLEPENTVGAVPVGSGAAAESKQAADRDYVAKRGENS